MEIEINEKKTNPYLNRTEVHFTITHENQKTPNRDVVRTELADNLNAKKENIIIERLDSGFGSRQTKGYAKIYSSRKDAEEMEYKYIIKRNAVKGKQKKSDEEGKEEAESAPEPSEEKENE
ncbi:MAG: 30S ribosomal protein S24e [Candidatus Thermoplasmatota archaeon]|nr:30S ribosomal protein S24e [Candidatus Thermoplasmatota archaeon]